MNKYQRNKKKIKEYYDNHKENITEYKKQYHILNREKILKKSKDWYEGHKEEASTKKKEYYKENGWLKTYYSICNRLKNHPHYVKKGIMNFLTKEDLKMLWFRDKAYKLDRVSIDRKDSNGHYTVENCRYIEYLQNVRKQK